MKKGEESRQRLIECAAKLFWKNGYSATGISEILKQTDLPGIKNIIEIGDSKYKKTGKHNLLTTMELMSLRYYSIYYPDVKDNIIE